jgi:hypothetical protein
VGNRRAFRSIGPVAQETEASSHGAFGRLRTLCDLNLSEAREHWGRHEYDGEVQDLSPAGVQLGLSALGGAPLADRHDEAHVMAFEAAARAKFDVCQWHRWNPLSHLENLDLSCYEREYADAGYRRTVREQHLRQWPDAVRSSLSAMDAVPRAVAKVALGPARALAEQVGVDGEATDAALKAHGLLVRHLEEAAESGPVDHPVDDQRLGVLMFGGELLDMDLSRLAERADVERLRVLEQLAAACSRLQPRRSSAAVVADLRLKFPRADELLDRARQQAEEVLAFTAARGLVPFVDGEFLVAPTPASRRWAMASLTAAAAAEADSPSCYHISVPDPTWPPERQSDWLAFFNEAMLPAVTAHEVAPGHFAHSRAIRRLRSPVRRTLLSWTCYEGWAHFAEELLVEHGFRQDDPRYAIGVALGSLLRIARLSCAIAVFAEGRGFTDAARKLQEDAYLTQEAAEAEVRRGLIDPAFGRYALGKIVIMDTREEAQRLWGTGYTDLRFATVLMSLGSAPLGLLRAAVIDATHRDSSSPFEFEESDV